MNGDTAVAVAVAVALAAAVALAVHHPSIDSNSISKLLLRTSFKGMNRSQREYLIFHMIRYQPTDRMRVLSIVVSVPLIRRKHLASTQ